MNCWSGPRSEQGGVHAQSGRRLLAKRAGLVTMAPDFLRAGEGAGLWPSWCWTTGHSRYPWQ